MLDDCSSNVFSAATPACSAQELRREDSDVGVSPRAHVPTFEVAYLEHLGFVKRLARRSGVHDSHIDDICQEVFLIVYRKLPTFEGRARLSTWIYRIVHYVVSNSKRSRSRGRICGPRDELRVELDDFVEDERDIEELLVRRELVEYGYRRLMKLSSKKRTAFLLNDLEGYSIQETARLTKTCPHTIRSRVRSVRRDMRLMSARFQ